MLKILENKDKGKGKFFKTKSVSKNKFFRQKSFEFTRVFGAPAKMQRLKPKKGFFCYFWRKTIIKKKVFLGNFKILL